jgi:hypothetical protein
MLSQKTFTLGVEIDEVDTMVDELWKLGCLVRLKSNEDESIECTIAGSTDAVRRGRVIIDDAATSTRDANDDDSDERNDAPPDDD